MRMRPRSLLYVPAHKPAMLAKIPGLQADRLVIDLEDGVPPSLKQEARQNLRALANGGFEFTPSICVRVNSCDSADQELDLELVDELRAKRIVIPKVEQPADLERIAEQSAVIAPRLDLMIETAIGVAQVRQLARHPRVDSLILGSADLQRSMGAPPSATRDWELAALNEVLLAARAAQIHAIDSVFFHFRDQDGLRAHARVARELGFDGKSAIHPAQLEPIHQLYASSPDEIAWARKIQAGWERLGGAERGVVEIDGEMIEALHLAVAERLLERAPELPSS